MYTLYGIKNCDTVKKARKWLENNNVSYEFHDFRVDGLSQEQLTLFIEHLSWEKLLNRSSTSWRQLSSEQQSQLNTEKALTLMLATPTLIKRPILVADDKYLLGFKAEQYQKLL
ncbi:MAG: ArsC family reductase [Methylococcaceae bacterium]|jgi:arsenate reductase